MAFITSTRIDEGMLVVLVESTRERHLCQPLQTNIKQIDLSSLVDITVILMLQVKKNAVWQNHLLIKIVPIKITFPPDVYELDSLMDEIKRFNDDKTHFTEADYPLTIKRILLHKGFS